MISVDTAIVGAGPAGAAAAHSLASAGHDVLLIDKATFPRDKFCGDGLTTLCLRQLEEMGFSPSAIPSFTPVHAAVLHAPKQCIAADGMWSPVRKMLGLNTDGYRGEWHAFRQYFEDGRANVGFGIMRGGDLSTQDMKALWPDLLQRPHIRKVLGENATPESPHRAWPIPARIDTAPLRGPRTMFVGDAATACDTLTGEGIGQALLTGREAA